MAVICRAGKALRGAKMEEYMVAMMGGNMEATV